MPLLINDHLANAYESLRSNRLRTGLTVLGVTIGIASITVILSLSAGATKIINDQVQELGGSIAVIRPGSPNKKSQINNLTATLSGTQATSSLTEQDIADIRRQDNVDAVAPIMLLGGTVTSGNNNPDDSSLIATTPDLVEIANLTIKEGQFIDSVTNRDTAVVGAQLAVDLFGTEQAVGRTFSTHGTTYTVIGILKRIGNPINYDNVDFDHTAIISFNSGKALNQGSASIQQIDVKTSNEDKLNSVISAIDHTLSRTHHGEKDYQILSGDSLSRPANELFYTVAATLTTVAAISLVVGGIGIM
ncbi:MAG: ABC transporter permease, partial [Candidatus Saccharimonadales bacterium]